uniref:Uncharacterized protein n=1 Tax=Romanomermis culicivorax TaxID=13658 RepID=A0A915J4N9_ROMCU
MLTERCNSKNENQVCLPEKNWPKLPETENIPKIDRMNRNLPKIIPMTISKESFGRCEHVLKDSISNCLFPFSNGFSLFCRLVATFLLLGECPRSQRDLWVDIKILMYLG